MTLRPLELLTRLRESYWLYPALLALAGVAAALALVAIDARIGADWLGRYGWFYGARPEGARQMLATIAGSTITVAGVVFSITLAAVTYASGQHGPRLLTNFIRDRGAQVTLGVFIGTYLYCLVVLRTIRSALEASAETGGALREAFVPHIAMLGGLALAVASIAVFIYFVGHVTDTIHINTATARIGRDLIAALGRAEADAGEAPPEPSGRAATVAAPTDGYVISIEFDALRHAAVEHGRVVRLSARAGDFMHKGQEVARLWPPDPLAAGMAQRFASAFALGDRRTPDNDPRFFFDQLVEIAARALSPGVNDPFTAIACVDWLLAATLAAARAPLHDRVLCDEDGCVRVVAGRLTFDDLLERGFGRLRPYLAGDDNAAQHALAVLAAAAAALDAPARDAVLAERDRLVARRGGTRGP